MTDQKEYIVQYVGFKTSDSATDFLTRWTPFAKQFKALGILSIDLYQTNPGSDIQFLSRNVWDSQTYFQNFPTGIAGSGGGGGIEVIQFGGYGLDKSQVSYSDEMKVVFLKEELKISQQHITPFYCATDAMPYTQIIEVPMSLEVPFASPSLVLMCKHITKV